MAEREKENESKSGMPIDGAQEKKKQDEKWGEKDRERKRNKQNKHMQKI